MNILLRGFLVPLILIGQPELRISQPAAASAFDESIKNALTGVDVVISTVAIAALDIQGKIVAAAKNADAKLFVPSEFGNITEGDTEGLHGTKANIQRQLKALGLPYAAFYTGKFPDSGWSSYVF